MFSFRRLPQIRQVPIISHYTANVFRGNNFILKQRHLWADIKLMMWNVLFSCDSHDPSRSNCHYSQY